MNIDWIVVRQNINFLVTLFRPTLAKALSVPLLMAGIGILNSPLWLDIVNGFLSVQEFYPQYKGPVSKPNEVVGWVFIALSFVIYFIEVLIQVKSTSQEGERKLLDVVKDHPQQTAELVVEKIRTAGFTAPHLQDEKIEKLASEITLLRFFGSFPKEDKAISLAKSIIDGELSGGTPPVKARALALVARYLCIGTNAELAKSYLSESKKLFQTEEGYMAQVLIEAIDSKNLDNASNLLQVKNDSNYSSFFIIKKIVEGTQVALDWIRRAEINVGDLDVDGKIILVSALLETHQWEKALFIVQSIEDEFFAKSPALAQVSAFAFLVNAVKAEELRDSVMQNIPFSANKFPLADDPNSIDFRNNSAELFKVCSKLARELGALDIADVSDKYAMWLELRNHETHETARKQLQHYFTSYTQKTLEYLPLAFVFGIEIDFESIEREINRQTALRNNRGSVLGLARFVLAQSKNSFPEIIKYIADHRVQLESGVNPITIKMLEIEALARSGLVDDAEQILNKLEISGVPANEINNLRNIIATAKGEDPIALALSQYQDSKTINDLSFLVSLLEQGQLRDKYYLYCRELFDRTGQELDAIKVCNAAASLGMFSELHQFLADRMELVKRSVGLQVHWAWALFRKGDLSGTKAQIAQLKLCGSKQFDIKNLEINLAIFGGDWEALSVFVEDKWSKREESNADDLLQAAQFAKAVSPSRAKQILEFITNKYPDNPQVLASSYFTATSMGWEDNQETSEWLHKAIILSNEDGPLHSASFEDFKEMISERRERNERVYKAYVDGDAPIFTVAELLNRAMSDFYLIQPLENRKATDIRRKNLIATFHSARLEQVISGEFIAIDASSALVMELLGVLEYLFNCFEKIVVPHYFMLWLYEEKQKVSFHQPSQIEKAKYFERLVSDGRISIFHPKKIGNPELAMDVGEELAYILEEAATNTTYDTQIYVVCSYPVYKVGGTFRELEVDLTSYQNCLISCSQLIKKIKSLAAITEAQCEKTLKYLRQHEKEWPNNLNIVDGATLFLDSLSITNLMSVDMLDKLSEAGFKLYVYKGERDRYKALINYDLVVCDAEAKLENVRKKFFDAINSNKIILASMPTNRDRISDRETKITQSTEELFEALKICDVILIDDRFMNRHATILVDGKNIPIFTTLDYLETLYQRGLISKEQKLDSRALLRESGFEFIPISSEELEHHIGQSIMVGSEFKPTRQLRLLKENFLLLKISGLVQLPRDAQWLDETMNKFTRVIKEQWSADISLELCRARCGWLYELMDFRGWAQTYNLRGDGNFAYIGEAIKISTILILPESLSPEKKEVYKAWLDEFILAPLRDIDPNSYKYLIESTKAQVKSISDQSNLEGELNE